MMGREKQTGSRVATDDRPVYFSRHAAGETRRWTLTEGTERRKPHRDLGTGTRSHWETEGIGDGRKIGRGSFGIVER
jgi:hypothetical protein